MCVDPERGKYMALNADDHAQKAFSWTSEAEAVGMLVALSCAESTALVEHVISIDTQEPNK